MWGIWRIFRMLLNSSINNQKRMKTLHFGKSQPPTANRQPPTANRQLLKAKIFLMLIALCIGSGLRASTRSVSSAMLPTTKNKSMTQGCEFYITKAIKNANGTYTICAESTGQNTSGTWTLKEVGGTGFVYTTSGTKFCITTPTGSGNLYELEFLVSGIPTPCYYFLAIFGTEFCPENLYTGYDGCSQITINDIFTQNGPFIVSFGQNIPALQQTESTITIPLNATEICITYTNPNSESVVSCCYPVPGNGCCNSANFSFTSDPYTTSCLNSRFLIQPGCINQGEHIWEFEDGKIFYGPNPPSPYIFSNFVNTDGEVCVKHTYICCGETLSVTKCLPHPNGAFIGYPGQDTKMSDLVHWWDHPNDISVLNFIRQYSGNPAVPLFIDGRLIVDITSTFNGGHWYMGANSEIYENGQFFWLNEVTIESAARLGPNYSTCCNWVGISSHGRTRIRMNNSSVNDATVMLHYESKSSIQRPVLSLTNSSFSGNYFGILDQGQPISIPVFSGNSFKGGEVCICGCDVVNAIDFRDIGTETISFPKTGNTNYLFNYEQGIHARNTRLKLYNFEINDLENFDDLTPWFNPSADDARIGVDYSWDLPSTSLLEMDNCAFLPQNFNNLKGMRTAVRERILNGTHTLTANASVPYSSITMAQVENGYDIEVASQAKITGSVKSNTINTNNSVSNTAVGLRVFSLGNTFVADDNKITVNGGSSSAQGIVVASPLADQPEDITITANEINLASTSYGNAIQLYQCRNTLVKNNNLTVNSNKPAIEIIKGGRSNILCNYIEGGNRGLFIETSPENVIEDNYMYYQKGNALRAQGPCSGTLGSLIAFNTFDFNTSYSVEYEKSAIVGVQAHNGYNKWIAQNGTELLNALASNAGSNRYKVPNGYLPGTINYPTPNTPLMTFQIGPYTFINNLCDEGDEGVGNNTYMDEDPVGQRYDEMLSDTNFTSSLTVAEYGAFKQSLMQLLHENPSWMSTYNSLNSFYSTELNGFTGKSVMINNSLKNLQITIQQQNNGLIQINTDIDSLTNLVEGIHGELDTATIAGNIANYETQINNLSVAINNLLSQASSLQNGYDLLNQVTINNIASLNSNLTTSGNYQVWEKAMNEIAFKIMQGQNLSATDSTDINTIAQACYKDGGRSVYMARNVSLTQLGKYFTDENCTPPPPVAPREALLAKISGISITPNPANDQLTIKIDKSWSNGNVTITMMDAQGKAVFSKESQMNGEFSDTIDVASLPSGLYFVHVSNTVQSKIEKIVIKH